MEAITYWFDILSIPFIDGVIVTLELFILTLLISVPFGIVIALGGMSNYNGGTKSH